MNRFFSIAAPGLWAAIVFILHVVKIEHEGDSTIPHLDKVVHFMMFFILSFLVVRMLQVLVSRHLHARWFVAVLVICLGYGALLEYLQSTQLFMRDSDILDWCADVLGSVVGCVAAARGMFPLIFLHQVWKTP